MEMYLWIVPHRVALHQVPFRIKRSSLMFVSRCTVFIKFQHTPIDLTFTLTDTSSGEKGRSGVWRGGRKKVSGFMRTDSMFELTKKFPVNEPQLLLLSCTFVRRTSMDMSVSQNNKNGPAKGIYGVTLRSSQPHFEKHGQASRTFFCLRV